MIRLANIPKPSEMTDEWVNRNTQTYLLDSNKAVWKANFIRNAIRQMGRGKCAYCELKLDNRESKYLTIDHFKPRAIFPDLVLEWDNLLPSCQTCNRVKGKHNVALQPIVNPRVQSPKDHIYLKVVGFEGKNYYRLRGLDSIGNQTLKVLPLDDFDEEHPRWKYLDKIIDHVQELYEDSISWDAKDQGALARIHRRFGTLLGFSQPDQQYGGLVASVLISNPKWELICAFIQRNGLWTEEAEEKNREAIDIALRVA